MSCYDFKWSCLQRLKINVSFSGNMFVCSVKIYIEDRHISGIFLMWRLVPSTTFGQLKRMVSYTVLVLYRLVVHDVKRFNLEL